MKTNIPEAPTSLTRKTKGIWRAINEEYTLEAESLETLRVALENLDLADKARQLLRTQGVVFNGKKHPASDSVKLHDGLWLRALRQLGLDVVAPGQAAGRRV